VVVWTGAIREKPANETEAREFLRGYAVHPAETVSAVVVTDTRTNERCEGIDHAKVWFYPIPDTLTEELIKEGRIFTTAGGFLIEDPKFKPCIKHIEGTMKSVLGLPAELMKRLLKKVSSKQ